MEPDSLPIRAAGVPQQQAGAAAGQFPLAPRDPDAVPARRRRPPRTRWLIAVVVALVAAGVAVAVADPSSAGGAGSRAAGGNTSATGTYTVARQGLSSQTEVPATLGYAASYSVAIPPGASAQAIAQAKQTVTADQQTLSADEQAESDTSAAGDQAIAADKANVSTGQSTLSTDQAQEAKDCTGSGASSAQCSQDKQKVSQDQAQLTQARQQRAAAEAAAKTGHDQAQAKVTSDTTKLEGDQATLASLQATEVNPGTTYTWLPNVGDVIKEDQRVYSVSNQPVPLLYGSIPAYRAFYVGMPGGADVGELTRDLIALGFGDGLARSNHYSAATAAAVKRWQAKLGLPVTGEILLGQVVIEPGPIRVTSIAASAGQAVGAGGGSVAGTGGAGGGGGAVLTATSTTRQVSIALDASQQSEVAAGDKVTITLPDNRTTPGVISSVGTVATTPPPGGGGSSGSSNPTITVLVKPTDPAATGTWDQAAVTVTITTGTVANALVVPVAALRARPGGGYAVEVAGARGFHHLVPVSLGLFDDAAGLVQVTGTSLTAGQRVVVPSL